MQTSEIYPIAILNQGKERTFNLEILRVLSREGPLAAWDIGKQIVAGTGKSYAQNIVKLRLQDLQRHGIIEISGQRQAVKNTKITVDVFRLTSKGCLVGLSSEKAFDWSKHWGASFFFQLAEHLRAKGAASQLIQDWIVVAIRDAIKGGLLQIDPMDSTGAEKDEEAFTALSFFLARRLTKLDTSSAKSLYDILSTKESRWYRAYLPRIMDPFYKTGVAGPAGGSNRSCLQCGIRFRPKHRIASAKFCSFDCYWASYNPLPTKSKKVKCGIRDCQNFIRVLPSVARRSPHSLHFCSLHKHRKKNKLVVTCACGCGSTFEVTPSVQKRNKLGCFYQDHWETRILTGKRSLQDKFPILDKARKKGLSNAQAAYIKNSKDRLVKIRCAYADKEFPAAEPKCESEFYVRPSEVGKRRACPTCSKAGRRGGWKLKESTKQKHKAAQREVMSRPGVRENLQTKKKGQKQPQHVREALSKARKANPPTRNPITGRFAART